MTPIIVARILACCRDVATEDDRSSLVVLKVGGSEDRNVDIVYNGRKGENDHAQLKASTWAYRGLSKRDEIGETILSSKPRAIWHLKSMKL